MISSKRGEPPPKPMRSSISIPFEMLRNSGIAEQRAQASIDSYDGGRRLDVGEEAEGYDP